MSFIIFANFGFCGQRIYTTLQLERTFVKVDFYYTVPFIAFHYSVTATTVPASCRASTNWNDIRTLMLHRFCCLVWLVRQFFFFFENFARIRYGPASNIWLTNLCSMTVYTSWQYLSYHLVRLRSEIGFQRIKRFSTQYVLVSVRVCVCVCLFMGCANQSPAVYVW